MEIGNKFDEEVSEHNNDEHIQPKEDKDDSNAKLNSCESVLPEQKTSNPDTIVAHSDVNQAEEAETQEQQSSKETANDTKSEEANIHTQSDSLDDGLDNNSNEETAEVESSKTANDNDEEMSASTECLEDQTNEEFSCNPEEVHGSDIDETDSNIDGTQEGPTLIHLTTKRVKAPKRNKPSQRFRKETLSASDLLDEIEEESENSNEDTSQELTSQNNLKENAGVQPSIRVPLARPPGSMCLVPPVSSGNTKPDWMQELNKKNKERKDKAAQEEKAAKEIEAPKDKEENQDVNDNPDASGCCIMF
eukprot:GFUD01013928.1.p1 GENE.GFUD01013928.1~~GFUD01013928.1.p1  ORF type:complete len:338 (-),score=113.20 GFUD01013928.1:146-1060(-)